MKNSLKRTLWLRRAAPILKKIIKEHATFNCPVYVQCETMSLPLAGMCLHYPGYKIATVANNRQSGIKALDCLLHELVHASVGNKQPHHGPKFQKLARKVGLVPPWARSTLGTKMRNRLLQVSRNLGRYPGT